MAFKIIKLLIESDAHVNAQNDRGETPLMLACQTGCSSEVCLLLLKDNPQALKYRDYELGGTALHHACRAGNYELCKLLIEQGFDPNSLAKGLSLLHLAFFGSVQENSLLKLCEYLFSLQNNPNIKDKKGKTPLHYACEAGYHLVVQKMLMYDFPEKLDSNIQCNDGTTALHYAVEKGHLILVKMLISTDVLVNIQDSMGKTPLHYAALTNTIGCLKELIENGASVDSLDAEKRTPLFYACSSIKNTKKEGNVDASCAQELIKAGAALDIIDKNGVTPLQWAVMNDSKDCIKVLIEAGASTTCETGINPRDNLGVKKILSELLYKAVSEGNIDQVKTLIFLNGADPKVHLKERPLLHIALEKGYVAIAEILIQGEANIN